MGIGVRTFIRMFDLRKCHLAALSDIDTIKHSVSHMDIVNIDRGSYFDMTCGINKPSTNCLWSLSSGGDIIKHAVSAFKICRKRKSLEEISY